MLPVLAVVGAFAAAWYVLIVRPQRQQEGRHAGLVGQLVVGAHVMTVGGIYGRIQAIDGNAVVVELAPGMVTRVATDGIARIVNSDMATLPELATPEHTNPGSPPIMDRNQHQPQHQPHVAPAQYAMPAPQLQAAPWQQPQVARAASGATTLRAQVQSMPMPVPLQPYAQPQAYSQPQAYAPAQAAPVLQPFPGMAPVAVQQSPAIPTFATTGAAYVPQQLMPAHAVIEQSVQTPVQAATQAETPRDDERTHSRAPEGMGATVRLDDVSIRDQVLRARSERQALAKEYERVTAPLVDMTRQPQVHHHVQHAPSELVASAPVAPQHHHNGHHRHREHAQTVVLPVADEQLLPSQQLFAASSSPLVQPIAQFPQPAAFQRNAPWAPDSREATPA